MSTTTGVINAIMSYQHHPVHLIGERLFLDFLNTANWDSDGGVAAEKLTCGNDLSTWKKATGLADSNSVSAASLAGEMLTFRLCLRRMVLAMIGGNTPLSKDIEIFNQCLAQARTIDTLVSSADALAFNPALTVTQIIALSALPVLASRSEMKRVKMCPGDNCGWLFLDESKNERRRWCSMDLCGNRAKARRHYMKRDARPEPQTFKPSPE